MADDKPIIVIKKKGHHGGHHGGAWKVAYADFVTAMMAFFMVMWLVNSASTPVKESVASYFRKPGIFADGSGRPLSIGASGILPDSPPPKRDEKKKSFGSAQEVLLNKTGHEAEGTKQYSNRGEMNKGRGDKVGIGEKAPTKPSDLDEGEHILQGDESGLVERVAEKIKQEVASSPELEKLIGIVDVKVDADGLNIEIMDSDTVSMFASGSASIQQEAEAAFKKIATLLKNVPNSIDIVGHTDAKPFSSKRNGYSNWELSSDRANAARRILLGEEIAPERITSVVGRADKDLKRVADPFHHSNRRITLKMRFKTIEALNAAASNTSAKSFFDKEKNYQEKEGEKVHSLTTKEVLNSEAPRSTPGAIIKLPKESTSSSNNPSDKPDPIFSESPVFGSSDPFSNF
jgi:chemotaxis protein MotB